MDEPGHVARTRAAYDATADVYAALVGTEIATTIEAPLDRALLAAFVELVGDRPGGRVADIGCGPGRVAAFLAARGLSVVGIDVSAAMLAVARDAHPGIEFEAGELADLPVADATLAGAVCWYSLIHTPPDRLAAVWSELTRALIPGGHLLVAFQAGAGEPVHRHEVHGRAVALTSYRHSPEEMARSMREAGLHARARAEREAAFPHESTPQAFILATNGDAAHRRHPQGS